MGFEDMDTNGKLDAIYEALVEQNEKLDELNEKISNLSLSGVDYEILDEN